MTSVFIAVYVIWVTDYVCNGGWPSALFLWFTRCDLEVHKSKSSNSFFIFDINSM